MKTSQSIQEKLAKIYYELLLTLYQCLILLYGMPLLSTPVYQGKTIRGHEEE